MNELGLLPSENKVSFGQLLGMCDQISFPLGRRSSHLQLTEHAPMCSPLQQDELTLKLTLSTVLNG